MDRPSRIVTISVRIRPAAPSAATSHRRLLASIAGAALAVRIVLAVSVPAALAACNHVLVVVFQEEGETPSCSIPRSGTPAETAVWIVARFFCSAGGASAFWMAS